MAAGAAVHRWQRTTRSPEHSLEGGDDCGTLAGGLKIGAWRTSE